MKTILISGGAGYLGTALTQELLKRHKVIVYDMFYFPWLLKNKNKIKYNKNLRFIKKNISDVDLNDFKNVDIVCDLNGISNDPSSELNASHTWELNYKNRLKFAKLAKKANVFSGEIVLKAGAETSTFESQPVKESQQQCGGF